MKNYRRNCCIVMALAFLLVASVQAQFKQQGNKLVGSGFTGASYQGNAVSISADGNTAVWGGLGDNGNVGGVWVFTRTNGVWSQQGTELIGTGAVGNPRHGSSIAISGDGNTIIEGGSLDNSSLGAAWIFVRSGGTWTQEGNKLVGSNSGSSFVNQGRSVAISYDGNTAIVGGSSDPSSIGGAAWIFTRSGGAWTQQGNKLVGNDAVGSSDFAGYSVSLSADGNTALVGGPRDDSFYGCAWVFTRSGSTWTQQGSKLRGTGGSGSFVLQGASVKLSADGNTAILGGNYDSSHVGASWIFTRTGSVWTQQGEKLVGSGITGSTSDQGVSVDLSAHGDTAIIGGNSDNTIKGAAWIFTRSGGVWTQSGSKLFGTGGIGSAQQGYSVAISADANTAIVGGYYDSLSTGAAWIYTNSLNFGGGGTGTGGYYYANSEPGGGGAPSNPVFSWVANTASEVDIANPTSGTSDDGYWGPISLPFSFSFFGNSYNSIYIGTNGVLSFGAGTSEPNNTSIPSASGPNNIIALAWDDMAAVPGTTHIYYGGNSSQFTITYSNLTPASSSAQTLTMQLILYPDGGIKMQYADTLTSADRSGYLNSNSIGLENSDGTLGVQYRYNGTGGKMFGSSVAVDFGLVPTTLAIRLERFTASSVGGTVNVQWSTATETDNYGFYVQRSISAGGPFASVSGLIPGNGTSLEQHSYSYADKNVAPGTYYYRIASQNTTGSMEYSNPIKFVVSGVEGVNDPAGLPATYSLGQNYPNPFNPSTSIRYELPVESRVTVMVFNVLGQQVAELANGIQSAGYKSVTLDASRFSSGIYFYHLDAVATGDASKTFTQVRKMILLK